MFLYALLPLSRSLDLISSNVWRQPFHPSTAYDGYSVTDYMSVDSFHGSWTELQSFCEHFNLMFDLVLNHCSVEHPWFKNFKNSVEPYKSYFITEWGPSNSSWIPGTVKRARNLPLLYPHEVAASRETNEASTKWVWSTYHKNMPDLNWGVPEMLLEWLDIMLDSVSRGCRAFRLDAFVYTLKRFQSNCVNIPECKTLMRLLQDCLMAAGTRGQVAVLPSITNVTQAENFEYLLQGASLVYHLPLSALVLHSLYSGDASVLSSWCFRMPAAPLGRALLNLISSHDGIGLTWCADILSQSQITNLIDCAKDRGGIIQYRRSTEASTHPNPWEINITYFSACALSSQELLNCSAAGALRLQADRLVAAQSIPLSLQGVPAIYFSLLVGGENDTEAVESILAASKRGELDPDAVCLERAINRERYSLEALEDDSLKQKEIFPQRLYLLQRLRHLLAVRRMFPAFHPDSLQSVLSHQGLPPSLFVLKRSPLRLSIYSDNIDAAPSEVVCITNFSGNNVSLPPIVAVEALGRAFTARPLQPGKPAPESWRPTFLVSNVLETDPAAFSDPAFDFGADLPHSLHDLRLGLSIQPYQIMWLVAAPQNPAEQADGFVLPLLKTLNDTCPTDLKTFSAICLDRPIGEIALCRPLDSPAASLGLTGSSARHRYRALPLDSSEGKAALQSPTAKVMHLIRHGEALHKVWGARPKTTSSSSSGDHCYDSTLPDKVTQLQEWRSVGTKNSCPYFSPCCFDPPLTALGRQACTPLGHSVDTVIAAAAHRTLESASISFANEGPSFIASEELRPMISPHLHSRRSQILVLKTLFPKFDYSSVRSNEDKMWDTCMASLTDPRSETRLSAESRICSLLERITSPESPYGKSVALVAHFTTFWLMQAKGEDGRIFGTRADGENMEPILDFSAFGPESEKLIMFELGQTNSFIIERV